MSDVQKKTAPEAATSETESVVDNKQSTDTIVAEAAEKIKVVIQHPGEISRIADINALPLNLAAKLSEMLAKRRALNVNIMSDVLVFDPLALALAEPVNVVAYGSVYHGTVAFVAVDGDTPVSLTPQQIQQKRAWLLRHSV